MADIGSDLELALRIRALVEGQAGITDLAGSFIDLNQRIENLVRSLTAVAGSQEGAARELEYITEVANRFGLSILDLSDNYIKLIASSKGTVLEGAAIKEVFESVSAAMNVLGADTTTTQRAFNALAQMMSKGQIYSEELKGQLAEAIPGALGVMSRALGITTQDLIKLMEQGSLTADVLLPFSVQLNKEFGYLAGSSNTFTQAVNRLKNTWTELMKAIGDTGAWKVLTDVIENRAEQTWLLAGAIGTGLAVAVQKATIAISGLAIASYNNARAFLAGAGATKQAELAALQLAESNVALTQATLNSALIQERRAIADVAAATSTSELAIANQRLAIAQKARVIADFQAAEATAALTAAQTRAAGSSGILAGTWRFLAGPGGLIALMVAGFAAMAYAFREQDDITKNLTKSTEEYNKELEKMTAAAITASSRKLLAMKADAEEEIAILKEQIDRINLVASAKAVTIEQEADIERARIEANNATIELEKAEAKLLDIEIKLGDSRLALQKRNLDLVVSSEKLTAESNNIAESINIQRELINKLTEDKKAGKDVDDELAKAYKDLFDLQNKDATIKNNLARITTDLKEATSAYAKYLLEGKSAQDLATMGFKSQGEAMLAMEEKIRSGVKALLDLTNKQQVLELSSKNLKAQNEALKLTIGDVADILLTEAKTTGDVYKIRDAYINQGLAQIKLAEEQMAVGENELAVLKNRLQLVSQELELNPKKETQLRKEYGAISDLITIKEAELVKGKENLIAIQQEAEARKKAFDFINDNLDRENALYEQHRQVIAGDMEVLEQHNQTNLRYNQIMQDEIALAKDLIEQQSLQIQTAEQELKATSEVADEIARRIAELEREKEVHGPLSTEQQHRLDLLYGEQELQKQAIEKSAEKVEQLKLEMFSIEGVAGQMQRIAGLADQEAQQNNKILSSKKERVLAEQELALAMGDTATANQKSVEAARIDAEMAKNVAEGRRQALQGAIEYKNGLENLAQADGIVTESELKGIEAARQVVASMEEQAAAAEKTADALKKVAEATAAAAEEKDRLAQLAAQTEIVNDALKGWHDRLAELNPALAETFDLWAAGARDATEGMSELGVTIQQHEDLAQSLVKSSGNTGFTGYLTSLAQKAYDLENAWISQAQQAEDFIRQLDRLGEQGGTAGGALDYLIRQAQAGVASFDLLDQQRLDNLQDAIDNATDKLQAMQQETEDARVKLAELNAELLEAKGLDEKAARLRQELEYQQQLAEIEKQRIAAQASGNDELLRTLEAQKTILDQINQVKMANIEADERAAAQQANAAKSGSQSAAGKTYNLNLNANGKTLPVTTIQDPEAFLSELERAQRSSL